MFDRQVSVVHGGSIPLEFPTQAAPWALAAARLRGRASHVPDRPVVRSVAPRLLGLALVLVAGFAAARLLGSVHLVARHQPTPVEGVLAAIAFVGASYGSALLTLGERMFEPVEVASRWCRHAA